MMPSQECPYTAFLAALHGEGGTPLKVEVSFTASDEVQQLRAQLAELQARYDELVRDFNKVEYRYRCEVMLNFQLQDIMQLHGIRFPDRLRSIGQIDK